MILPSTPSPRSFMTTSRQVRLARRPEGEPDDDTFVFEEHELPALRGRPAPAAGRLPLARPLHAGPVERRPVVRRAGGGGRRHRRRHGLRGRGDPRPVVRRGRRGALLLRLADPRDRRGPATSASSTRPQRRSPRRSGCWGCPGSRRTPGSSRSAGRNRARPSWSPPPPGPSGRPSARSRRSRAPGPSASPAARRSGRRCSTSSASTSRSTTAPPRFADDLAKAVPGRRRRLLRERRRSR